MFFQPHKDRSGGAYCIMNKDGAIHVLPGTTKEDVLNAGFNPNKIAVYYDEARTVDMGVKFQPTAFALQTIDPASASLRDLPQGSMRMRQPLSCQRVHLVCAKQDLEAKGKARAEPGRTAGGVEMWNRKPGDKASKAIDESTQDEDI